MKLLVVAVLVCVMSGCAAMQERRWSYCAVGGGILGAAVGAGTAGGLVNAYETSRTHEETGAAAGAGAVGGAVVGTLLGHLICDPVEEAPPPPPVAQLPPPPPPPAPGTKMVELRGPHFDFDKATLKPEGKRKVDDGIKMMKENPSLRVSVEGHTDSIGSDAYNQRLSERRANAVRDYMVDQGISSSRITTKGWGESKPAASNKTEEGRAQNRRVEIIAQ
jgi:OOP family OmpA-OmpF porin